MDVADVAGEVVEAHDAEVQQDSGFCKETNSRVDLENSQGPRQLYAAFLACSDIQHAITSYNYTDTSSSFLTEDTYAWCILMLAYYYWCSCISLLLYLCIYHLTRCVIKLRSIMCVYSLGMQC